jgi:hypothetical protein
VWEGRSREAPPYPDHWHFATGAEASNLRPVLEVLRTWMDGGIGQPRRE